MTNGFWNSLQRPVLALAPMAGVTDTAFRQIIAKYGKPDVCFTEFTSTDGLCSAGRKKLSMDLWFHKSERPIVAQIFGSKPENFYKTAQLIEELGFDGIDINTGCPDKCVEKQGSGAALILNPELTKKIIKETKRGAGSLPVSVKTRLGYDKNNIKVWLRHLLETEPAAVTIHARTRQEMSKVPARWEAISGAVQIRDDCGSQSLILGNGDIKSIEEARKTASIYGPDGIMIGRGIYGNPWLFNRNLEISRVPWKERLRVMVEHARLFEETFSGMKSFAFMRKFFNSYVSGVPSAKNLKMKLMATMNSNQVEKIVADYIHQHDLDQTTSNLVGIPTE